MEQRGRLGSPIEFVAVGHVAVDIRHGRSLLGGAAAFSALTASRLGLPAAVVTALGVDFELFGELTDVEVHFHRCDRSTTFENHYEDEKRRQRLLARAEPIRLKDLSRLGSRLAEDAAVLFCPISREVHLPLRRLTPRGLCGVAPQGFFRRWDRHGWVRPVNWHGAVERLAAVDLVSLSVDDPPDPEDFRIRVAPRVSVLAMTEGERGARIFTAGRGYHVPSFQRRGVDPTGAGDVFAASLLIALREGRHPLEGAQFASCAASFAVERDGVEGVPPSREAVEDRLRTYRTKHPSLEIPQMKDEELEAYCTQIEGHFFRLKHRPGILSPQDFSRVRRWFEEGVSLEAVLDGISEAFRVHHAGRDAEVEEVNSLGYCETFVRRAAERRASL